MDGNVYDEDSAAAARLRELEADRWILLQSTFSILNEVAATEDTDKRDRMLDEAEGRLASLDVWVLGYGKLGQVVVGGEADAALMDRIWQVAKPGVDRATASDSHHRDVIALHTAIRNRRDGFITRDRQLLNKAGNVKAEFSGFLLFNPEDCVEFVQDRVGVYRRRTGGGE